MGRLSFKSLFGGRSGDVTYAGRDASGSDWYLPSWAAHMSAGLGGSTRLDFDMRTAVGRAEAMACCYPLSVTLGILGDMIQNGRLYVTDAEGNEGSPALAPVEALLRRPNPMQTGKAFLKQVEMNLECHGVCPVYALRATPGAVPAAMTVIPPELFHMEGTGRLFMQSESSGVVRRAYISWGGAEVELEEDEYFLICDGHAAVPPSPGGEITFHSPVDTLSMHIRNYMAQLAARGNLIVNGGPKGILYGDDTSEAGNAALTPRDADALQDKFKRKYGIVNKLYEIMVTPKKLGWITLGANTDQLKLYEEDARCVQAVAQAVGIDPNLVTQGSTYDNSAAAKKSAYQDVVIPDALCAAESLTRALCPEGGRVEFDFTHVPYLQEDLASAASALSSAASAVGGLYDRGLVTMEEARAELSRYIDIDPTSPAGAFAPGTAGNPISDKDDE